MNTRSYEIRMAQRDDLNSISELLYLLKCQYGSCKENNKNEFTKNYKKTIELILNEKKSVICVAETNDKQLIGFISFSIRNVMRANGQLATLEEIYVDSKHRRTGGGESLWRYSSALLKSQGVDYVEATSSLAHPGQREFYKKLGIEWYSNIHRVSI